MKLFPALRPVDVAPFENEGEMFVCLYDNSGYVDEQIVLSPPAYFIAACLDGQSGIEAIQAAFRAQFKGATPPVEKIEEIVAYLDQHGFLESPTFHAIRERIDGEFRSARIRPAHLAGRSYPEDAAELRQMLDAFFECDDGPGALGEIGTGPAPKLVISPHIDFQRGGAGYAHAYRALHAAGKPELVVIFGVAHAWAPSPFILTRKDFATPFGTLRTDVEFVDKLAAACEGWDPFAHEGVHRTEHSAELQAVMLAYLFGEGVKIVPILCGPMCGENALGHPAQDGRVQRFLETCRALCAEHGRRVTVIAGADLAHVGQRFGDPIEIDEVVTEAVAARDREDLAHVSAGDAEGWYASVLSDGNARKVCGLGCIYAALKSWPGDPLQPELLHYDYAPDPAGGMVSFASLVSR